MRIVADTNTVLSGLLWQGAPRRLLDLARERKITLCTSLVLLAELAEVMARDKFAERLRAAGVSAIELLQDYERLAETVTPEALPTPVIERDPDDDHVLACAVSAEARSSSPATPISWTSRPIRASLSTAHLSLSAK